jgi:N-acetylmuramoyl-L-alanine amidase
MRNAGMPIGRFSGRCGVAEPRAGSGVCAVLLFLLLAAASPVSGQHPSLRLSGAAPAAVDGVHVDGAAAYPAGALELLGFRLAADPSMLLAVLGADTLRFWATSPFFRAAAAVHQLAFPVHDLGGVAYLPEQFFIQWLPTAYPEHYEFRGGALAVKSLPAGAAVVAGAAPPSPLPSPAAAAEAERRRTAARTRVVVIDPGHGGRDPGKIGPNRLAEKEVALLISQRLATILRERGYEVHLTRTTDTLISLMDRPRLANQWRGDRPGAVFLSIHANSAPSTAARGFETFFLSEARTEDERRVAEMENEAIRFEDTPTRPTGNELDQILSGLRSDFLTRASHDLAAVVQEKMAAFHPGPNRGVKRAGFYVLVGAIMPAVLIETAFISNREEAGLLGTQAFQQKLVWGIADAVDEFFRRHEHLWVQEQ